MADTKLFEFEFEFEARYFDRALGFITRKPSGCSTYLQHYWYLSRFIAFTYIDCDGRKVFHSKNWLNRDCEIRKRVFH
jgi:hypothetical protein